MKQTRELDSDVAPRSEVKYSIWNTVCVCSRARLSRSSILFVYVVTLVQGVMLCLDYRQGPWRGLNSHTVAFLSSQFFISLIQFKVQILPLFVFRDFLTYLSEHDELRQESSFHGWVNAFGLLDCSVSFHLFIPWSLKRELRLTIL